MIENLNKYAGIIPIVAIIVYLLGYVSLGSYLNSYGVDESLGLDFAVLRHGMLLSVAIGPVVALCYADFQAGNYDNVDPSTSPTLIHNLHDALGYTVLYSLSIGFVFFGRVFDMATAVMLIILAIGALLNKLPMNEDLRKGLKGLFLISPLFIFTAFTFLLPIGGKVSFYSLQLLIFFGCSCLRIYNKDHNTYQASKVGAALISIVAGAALFGGFVINDIQVRYGGELRPQTVYYLNSEKSKTIAVEEICREMKSDGSLSLRKIYEGGNKYYFLTSKKKVFALPMDYFEASQSLIPSGYPPSTANAKQAAK